MYPIQYLILDNKHKLQISQHKRYLYTVKWQQLAGGLRALHSNDFAPNVRIRIAQRVIKCILVGSISVEEHKVRKFQMEIDLFRAGVRLCHLYLCSMGAI